ncbi:glycoside hydrolase family 2 protein [Halorussus amylolyticus]|uniref:hydrolase n=1 Tax=Halorussus amylolyticus TaxID=1126242 RepID=UPI001042F453|nr:hydrolase [Halorussus amylolyticus]
MSLTDWTGAVVDSPAGDEPPSPDDWHPVEVPGRPERFAGADVVAYRTRFSDPRDDDERATLELRGLFARARIWLNGDLLGDHDAYFVPARYELDLEAENELVVECRGPDRFGGVYATDRVPDERAVPGIWWDADLETHPETFLDTLSLTPRTTDDGAVIDAKLAVEAGADVDERISFSVRPQGFRGGGVMERARVDAESGERVVVEKTLELRDPAYWWPAGDGPQHKYAVRAKLGDSERVVETGICEVADTDNGLVVNGQRVPARGFSLLPTGDPTWDVERAGNANANVVRAYGHVPSPAFYEAAADAGVLVWQDLPVVGPGEYDTDRATALAGALASEIERHPCVAAFGVHADPTDHLAGIGPSRLARYKVRWRAWRANYDDGTDQKVAEALPDDALVVPVSGAPGIDADASHLYPGWDYGTAGDAEWLLDRYDSTGVVGGFGAGALAVENPEAVAGFDAIAHDANVSTGGGDGASEVETSQAYQARVLKTVTETLRRKGTEVLVADALRDTDAGAGMGVLAADGTEKLGYDAVAASLEPVQVVLDAYPEVGTSRELVVVDDTPESVSGTISWTAGDRNGGADVSVGAFGRETAGTLRVPDDAESVELAFEWADGSVSNEYPL